MNRSYRNFVVLSWNVRGLGQSDKRVVVKDNIHKNHPQLVCLQETKLNAVDSFCFRSFITPPTSMPSVLNRRMILVEGWLLPRAPASSP
jgi:hypothetical protein